ncbi:MAG: ABC transporter ATP-binding protein [Ruminococcaceae bacterium]|nr:ABC transporter ATP-binding protein [Oscillospiraceae bacterium]
MRDTQRRWLFCTQALCARASFGRIRKRRFFAVIFGKYINRYYLKNAPALLLGLLALLTVDYIQLLIPRLYRLVINGVNLGQVVVDGQTLAFTKEVLFRHICGPMIGIIVLMVIGRFLWRICFFGSAVRVAADLRERMFDHSRRLSQQYYQVNKVGNLMSLYTNDLDTIQECFGDGVLMFFDALTLGLLALYKMWSMDRQLTLLALIPAVFMFAAGTLMGKLMTKTWEKRQQAFSDLSDFAQENFSGIAVIKAFVKELKELHAFRKLNQENEKINVAYTRISVLLEILVTLFVESVICVILGYGGYLVYTGRFNAGQLVEYIGYFEAIVWPIMAVSMLIEKSSRGKASLNRISELLDAPIDVADRPGVPDLENPKGGIEFRHLTFRYPDGEFDVLKDVSFAVAPGESVGIVGKTGAGKTALVDLLLRTYNVADGTLFVDGQDVNRVSIHSVRNACAYVPQDNFLFSDTIAHNIGFGVDDATPEEIDRAAALADVRDNIVDFKDGYETVLGERGVTVSGGQKQRISIARALLKNAPILILDDSVSAVDTRTEKIILENLKESRVGKTTLLIAHRISTVEGLDKIVFLEDGRVEAVGPHDALYASCEEYRRMVDLQRLEDEVGGGNA